MGTWDYGPLDNDAASEVKYLWDTYVLEKIRSKEWNRKQAIDYFLRRWDEAIEYGDSITNSEIIALAELITQQFGKIPKSFLRVAEAAVSRELQDVNVESWKEPKRRKEALLAFLKRIGGKRQKVKPPSFLGDRFLDFPNDQVAFDVLSKLIDCHGKGPVKFIQKNYPRFLIVLERYLNHGMWEKDSSISDQAWIQRRMMLAYWLGTNLKLPKNRIQEMMNACRF
jgi:hypothetical protein